jgi:hypothetical protein
VEAAVGWLKLLLNASSAEGVREAMRMSYKKHFRRAMLGKGRPGTSPHQMALYGAMGTRYMTRGQEPAEAVIWAEVAPFMKLERSEGIEALAEYVVFQERPAEARVDWLTERLEHGRYLLREDEAETFVQAAQVLGLAWYVLLGRAALREAVAWAGEQICPLCGKATRFSDSHVIWQGITPDGAAAFGKPEDVLRLVEIDEDVPLGAWVRICTDCYKRHIGEDPTARECKRCGRTFPGDAVYEDRDITDPSVKFEDVRFYCYSCFLMVMGREPRA